MRKLVLVLAILLTGVVTAQDRIAEFSMSGRVLFDKETDNLYLIFEDNIGIDFENKETKQEFIDMISTSYTKGKKWGKIAKENNTKDFHKDIDKMWVDGMFRSSKWFFGRTTVKTVFYWENGQGKMYVYLHKITANDNQYIESDSSLIPLDGTTVLEVEKKLSQKFIDEYYSAQNKHDNLFQ